MHGMKRGNTCNCKINPRLKDSGLNLHLSSVHEHLKHTYFSHLIVVIESTEIRLLSMESQELCYTDANDYNVQYSCAL